MNPKNYRCPHTPVMAKYDNVVCFSFVLPQQVISREVCDARGCDQGRRQGNSPHIPGTWLHSSIHYSISLRPASIFMYVRPHQLLYAGEGEARKPGENYHPPELNKDDKPGTVQHKGHEFIPISFHMPATCESCPRPLWHMFKPPPALECRSKFAFLAIG